MEDNNCDRILPFIAGGAFAIALPLIVELGPPLIRWAMQIYDNAMSDPETPEEKRAHYAKIASALETASTLVQNAPLPPTGSGR